MRAALQPELDFGEHIVWEAKTIVSLCEWARLSSFATLTIGFLVLAFLPSSPMRFLGDIQAAIIGIFLSLLCGLFAVGNYETTRIDRFTMTNQRIFSFLKNGKRYWPYGFELDLQRSIKGNRWADCPSICLPTRIIDHGHSEWFNVSTISNTDAIKLRTCFGELQSVLRGKSVQSATIVKAAP